MNLTLLSFKSNRREKRQFHFFTFPKWSILSFSQKIGIIWKRARTMTQCPIYFLSSFRSQITSNVSNLFRNSIIAYAFRTSTMSYCKIVKLQEIICTLFFFNSHATFLLSIAYNFLETLSLLSAFITYSHDTETIRNTPKI